METLSRSGRPVITENRHSLVHTANDDDIRMKFCNELTDKCPKL